MARSRSAGGIKALLRSDVARLEAYQPVEPPEALAARAGVPQERIVKLNGNENPYGPSPRARQALAAYPYYHIYPDPAHVQLRDALTRYTGVSSERIVVGNGSDEIIDLLLRAVLEPGDKVINCEPTFGMYSFSTHVCGGQVADVPRANDFRLDVPAIEAAVNSKTKVIFVANPNNPTGTLTPVESIERLLRTGVLVVADEAYFEFCDQTALPLLRRQDNLVVLRTFSKWAGLAGLRIGYGLMAPELAQVLMRLKPPYNVNVAAMAAAQASLEDIAYLMGNVRRIVKERERLQGLLAQVSFLHPYPSHANFILCRVKGMEARRLYEELARRGVFLRYYDTPHLKDCIRTSVGMPQHTDALMAALAEIGK